MSEDAFIPYRLQLFLSLPVDMVWRPATSTNKDVREREGGKGKTAHNANLKL